MRRLKSARLAVVCGALACLILSAACSSGNGSEGDETPSPTPAPVTPTAAPTAMPTTPAPSVTPTRMPTARPTNTPPAGPGLDTLPVSAISIPACQSPANGGSGNQGTAPGPTPTPVPLPEDRDPAEVLIELSEYLTRAVPVAEHLSGWDAWFVDEWGGAGTPEEQAALLHLFGARLAQACGAVVALGDVPIEAAGINTLLYEAARARHAWALVAVNELRCCGTANSGDIPQGNASTSQSAQGALPALEEFAAEYGALAQDGYDLEDSVMGLEAVVWPGWLAASDGLTKVFIAPFQYQLPTLAGMGPESWLKGAGVSVRRLRNPGEVTPAQASEQFVGLITRQGEVGSTAETDVNGLPALRHDLATGDSWAASVTVTVAGDFTYFIETGCLPAVSGSCEEVERLVDALSISQ